MENLLVCKICEHPIIADKLHSHSVKCKEAAEIKQKVLSIKENLFALIEKAYHLKTQLNTNVAIQKCKKKKQEDLGPDGRTKSSTNSPNISAQKDRPTLRMNLPYLMNDLKINGLESTKKAEPEPISDEKMQLFEKEFNKAMIALKGILYYGTCLSKTFDEIDGDTARDLKIKNEIHLLYSEIRDKKVSQYLQQFLDTLQDYIVHKRKLDKKIVEIESISKTSGHGPLNAALRISKGRHKRHISAVKPLVLKEFSEDGTPHANSPSLSRFQTLPTNISPKRATVVYSAETKEEFHKSLKSALAKNFGPSPFQWGPDGSVTTREKIECMVGRTKSNNWAEDLERLKNEHPSQRVEGRFLREFQDYVEGIKRISFSPEHRVRSPPKDKAKRVLDRLKKSYSLLVPEKLGSEKSDQDSETDSNGSMVSEKKESGQIAEQTKKSKFANKKKLKKRRLSLKDIYRGEDIETLVDKSLKLVANKEQGKQARVSEIKQGEKKVANEYISMTMKGYYSDSALNEKRKVAIEKMHEVGIDDFEFLKFLGKGAYGRIYLVRKKSTGDQYAMKIVDFADMETTQNKFASLKTERNVYQSIMGEWVVKAFYTFSYQNYICFVLEYMIGGDLASLLEQIGCFDECVARFYFAELVLALESLHKLGIIHRDLKPDNVLIDAEGHIKLTDFGLSEQGLNKLKRMATINSNNTSLRDLASSRNNLSRKNIRETNPHNNIHTKDSLSIQFTPHSNASASGQSKHTLNSMSDANDGRFSSHVNSLHPANGPMDPYIVRNKKDEEVIFTFLEEGGMTRWLSLNKIDKVSSSTRKKEVFRIVGTPDYMAPEIIMGEACNRKSLDLWGLGVILYELLVGVTPFNDETVDKVFSNIISLKMDWPKVGFGDDCITEQASDLIESLLRLEPSERLTISGIKAHPFFDGLDWDRVKEMQAPIVPHKEEHEGQKNLLKPQSIFEDKKNSVGNSANMKEMSSFNMKRIDLLHQLNEEIYNTLKRKEGSIKE